MSNKEEGRRKKGMDLGRVLLWAAVVVSAPRWAGAMLAADVYHIQNWLSAFLNGANTLSGLGMGVLEVMATAYLLDALRQTRPTITHHRKAGDVVTLNWRFYGILAFAAGLLAMTPIVLAPYLVSRMTGQDIGTVLATRGWQYIWAVTVVVVPVFVVGGVAFAQTGLVRLSTDFETDKRTKTDKRTETDRSGGTPEDGEGRRKISGEVPEEGPMYRSFRDIPETEWQFLANAETAAIVKRFHPTGRDPLRVARAWRQEAVEALKKRGGQKDLFSELNSTDLSTDSKTDKRTETDGGENVQVG